LGEKSNEKRIIFVSFCRSAPRKKPGLTPGFSSFSKSLKSNIFHVKGDSHPPSQSPMRVAAFPQITFVCSLKPGLTPGFFVLIRVSSPSSGG
jgi:hypothetical protein